MCVRIDHSLTQTHTLQSISRLFADGAVQILKKWNKNGAFSEHRSSVMVISVGTSNSHSLTALPRPPLSHQFVVWRAQKFDSYELICVPEPIDRFREVDLWKFKIHIQIRRKNQFNTRLTNRHVQLNCEWDLLTREFQCPFYFENCKHIHKPVCVCVFSF